MSWISSEESLTAPPPSQKQAIYEFSLLSCLWLNPLALGFSLVFFSLFLLLGIHLINKFKPASSAKVNKPTESIFTDLKNRVDILSRDFTAFQNGVHDAARELAELAETVNGNFKPQY